MNNEFKRWFCNKLIVRPKKKSSILYCNDLLCYKHNTRYIFDYNQYNLYKIGFDTRLSSKLYILYYLIESSAIEIYKQAMVGNYLSMDLILTIDSNNLILTPQNINTKLPTLITFS